MLSLLPISYASHCGAFQPFKVPFLISFRVLISVTSFFSSCLHDRFNFPAFSFGP